LKHSRITYRKLSQLMKLATVQDQQQKIGIVEIEGQWRRLSDVLAIGGINGISTIDELIQKYSGISEKFANLVHDSRAAKLTVIPEKSYLAPVLHPSKIVGVALNNSMLMGLAWKKFSEPAFFMKGANALTGHQQAIEVATDFGLTHLEAELAAVIGKRCKNVPEKDALNVIFGYTVMNDVTSPGLKDKDSIQLRIPGMINSVSPPNWRQLSSDQDKDIYLTYHARSKSCDTFAPMGPWIVTADEIANPNQLGIKAWVDQELASEDSTANLTFSVQKVIATLTKSMTLEPGDIVHFGTAARFTGNKSIRDFDFSKFGDSVSIEIERIGTLTNAIKRIAA
jgi:2-keto-4-pentenoate hydratase/2-oxohepta-3-ene-1,7-dioic acid hydratase in catechol pathway